MTIQLESPLDALAVGTGRRLSSRIAAAEALQLIGGFSEPEWLCKIAPAFERYREDIEIDTTPAPDGPSHFEHVPWFHGAYGNRIRIYSQLDTAVRRLHESPSTRQAVVSLWQPELDTEDSHLDYPCTVALNFRRSGTRYRQHDRLDTQVLMRSNDVWTGTPYDIFMFTQLQLTLCRVLDLEPGTYTHTAWSAHLYLTDFDASYRVTDRTETRTTRLDYVTGIGREGDDLDAVRRRAYEIYLVVTGQLERADFDKPTQSEEWYLDVLSASN